MFLTSSAGVCCRLPAVLNPVYPLTHFHFHFRNKPFSLITEKLVIVVTKYKPRINTRKCRRFLTYCLCPQITQRTQLMFWRDSGFIMFTILSETSFPRLQCGMCMKLLPSYLYLSTDAPYRTEMYLNV